MLVNFFFENSNKDVGKYLNYVLFLFFFNLSNCSFSLMIESTLTYLFTIIFIPFLNLIRTKNMT